MDRHVEKPTRTPTLRARVVIVEDGRLALIKRVRDGRTYYLFPGGGVETGESPEQAAAREAREELGVDIRLGAVLHRELWELEEYVYYAAEIVGGEFGTGVWPDHVERDEETRERHGTYEAVWVALPDLPGLEIGLDVRPRALVARLLESK